MTDLSRFGFSHIVSSGNEAVLTAADFLEYLVEDAHTAVIGCFIEAVREPEHFAAALDRAAALDKPIIVLKVGRSERTRRAVQPHGGLPATRAFSNCCAPIGRSRWRIPSRSPNYSRLTRAPATAGRRIGAITSSGGLAELMLDIAEAADLVIASAVADKGEDRRLVGYVTGDGNPLDAWGNGTFIPNLPLLSALQVQSRSRHYRILPRQCDGQPMDSRRPRELSEAIRPRRRGQQEAALPLHTRGGHEPAQVECLRAAGIPIVGGIREGSGAIDRLARWGVWRRNTSNNRVFQRKREGGRCIACPWTPLRWG